MLTSHPPRRTALLASILALAVGCQDPEADVTPASAPASVADTTAREVPGILYGRVLTHDGETYEGRLRWGGDEEAFWDDAFNGVKDMNPWAQYAPVQERTPTRFFGIEIAWGDSEVDLSRPFLVRFGDVARIESVGDGVQGVVEDGAGFDPDVRVTLKSGTVFDLDRLEASDFDDGVRVWDEGRGVVDVDAGDIRAIELLPTPRLGGVPARLHGTVQTSEGAFTGFLQWDRDEAFSNNVLVGRTEAGERAVRFDAIRAVVPEADGARVTLRDGSEVVLTGTQMVGPGHRGVDVADPRYGRVRVSWGAVQRVDFRPAGSGPAYSDFRPGRPLSGTVTTRDGRRLRGRLVYDLDESETTETLDAPAAGVDYTIPFGLVAAIDLPGPEAAASGLATVTLQSGETLDLGRSGDLSNDNAGLLVFAAGDEDPEFVPWADVARIDFDPEAVLDDRLGE